MKIHSMRIIAVYLAVLLGFADISPGAVSKESLTNSVADRFADAVQNRHYHFVTEVDLARRKARVAAFAAKYLPNTMDAADADALLTGETRCLDRLLDSARSLLVENDERAYLCLPDLIETFEWHLWIALKRPPLDASQLQDKESQRDWLTQYFMDLPLRPGDARVTSTATPDEARPWVLAQLKRDYDDPFSLLYDPLSASSVEKLKARFGKFSNGLVEDYRDVLVEALAGRFPEHPEPKARYGQSFTSDLPFDDTVVDLWGNGPHLFFASNADFCGMRGSLIDNEIFDVARSVALPARPEGEEKEHWLNREARGDLGCDDKANMIFTMRGAKFARLEVGNWLEADQISNAELTELVGNEEKTKMSIKSLPPVNGARGPGRPAGEFFIVVRTTEARLAVLDLQTHEFGSVELWCRPRAEASITIGQ